MPFGDKSLSYPFKALHGGLEPGGCNGLFQREALVNTTELTDLVYLVRLLDSNNHPFEEQAAIQHFTTILLSTCVHNSAIQTTWNQMGCWSKSKRCKSYSSSVQMSLP